MRGRSKRLRLAGLIGPSSEPEAEGDEARFLQGVLGVIPEAPLEEEEEGVDGPRLTVD